MHRETEGTLHTVRLERLATLIDAASERDGAYATPIPGFYLSKLSTTAVPRNTIERAVFCLVAQGAKSILLGDRRYVYDSSSYLVVSLGLPIVGEIVEATPERPFLGVSMELDAAEIAALIVEARLNPASPAAQQRGLFVSRVGDELLDAVLRLVSLLRVPERIPIMAPLLRREILYLLLLSEQSGFLRRIAVENSQAQRIAAGLEFVRKNVNRTIRMEELAREVQMSPSAMHAWFKTVTTMSPLQFQKQLRLQEARRILLTESTDAATASQRVGYESPSQFSREYRRLFGLPPLRDVERLRAVAEGLHVPPFTLAEHAG